MSIEKKSLISTLKTAKKANMAKEDFGNGVSSTPVVKSATFKAKASTFKAKASTFKAKATTGKAKASTFKA